MWPGDNWKNLYISLTWIQRDEGLCSLSEVVNVQRYFAYAIIAFVIFPVLCYSQSRSNVTVAATRKAAVAAHSNSNKEQDFCDKRFKALQNQGTEALTRAYLDSCTNGIEVSDPNTMMTPFLPSSSSLIVQDSQHSTLSVRRP